MNTTKKSAKNTATEIARNRRANFDYNLGERFEAGLMLQGWEVKSLRAGRLQLINSFVGERAGELYLMGAHVSPLESASTHITTDELRYRKLLLNRKEVSRILAGIREKGRTCVCISVYWKKGKAKAAIALAAGKKQHDKRAAERDKEWVRTRQRVLKNRR